jgi:hypothetical protein
VVAAIGILVVVVAATFSPWLVYATAAPGSLAATQFSAALPIFGSGPFETLAYEAELKSEWVAAALFYGAAADAGGDPHFRSEEVRMWAFAGLCDRAAGTAQVLDPVTQREDRRYAEDLVEWCEETGGRSPSG